MSCPECLTPRVLPNVSWTRLLYLQDSLLLCEATPPVPLAPDLLRDKADTQSVSADFAPAPRGPGG